MTSGTMCQTPLGRSLRYWRKQKKVSQLSLALISGVSSRHISFIETGKTQPSREVVLYLTKALQLSSQETNGLLVAAGYVANHSDGRSSLQTERIHDALQLILKQQEPFPAMVTGPSYDFVMVNQGFKDTLSYFLPSSKLSQHPNFFRLVFANEGLRPFFEDWPQICSFFLTRLHREVLLTEDPALQNLLDELVQQSGRERYESFELDESDDLPLVSFKLRKGNVIFHFFSSITTFGSPRDIAVEELRIDTLFPADETTRQLLTK